MMDTTNQNAGGARGKGDDLAGADATVYWRACASLRAGEIAAGIAPLLAFAWTPTPALRARVRAVLADHGLPVLDDAAPVPAHRRNGAACHWAGWRQMPERRTQVQSVKPRLIVSISEDRRERETNPR